MRRSIWLSVMVTVLLFSGALYSQMSSDEAWTNLVNGNNRFVSGELAQKDIGAAKRMTLAKGQSPSATVVTCSDSRVSPELLFDQGLGDVFVIRTAGNVLDKIAIGSIEYGVEHLHTPVLVIMGHSSCGAVTAALDLKGRPKGNIGAIVKKILPAVKKAKESGKTDRAEVLNLAVQENVKRVAENLMKHSHIIKELVESGKLKIVMAEYMLDSGKVEVIESPIDTNKHEHHKHEHHMHEEHTH